MKNFLILLCLFVIAVAVLGAGGYYVKKKYFDLPLGTTEDTETITGTPVSFERLAQGSQASVETRINYMVETEAEYRLLWSLINPTKPAPSIDFSKYVVIGVFAGKVSTAGYEIKVSEIRDDAQRTVYVTLTRPGANCFAAQSVTAPYDIIKIPKTSLELTHKDTTEVRNCKL